MRKELHIALCLFTALTVSILYSCGPSSREKQESYLSAENTPSVNNFTLEETFEADTLSHEQLNVFQQRAQQKTEDFISYIEIISNKSYDSLMRLEAKKQIEDLFADSSTLINVAVDKSGKYPTHLYEFINEVYESKYDSIKIKTGSVIMSPPQKAEENAYNGSLTAEMNVIGYKNAQISFNSEVIHEVKTIIRKTQKQFGNDTRKIWTVTLGEFK